MDRIDFEIFCRLLNEHHTYAEISEILKQQYPGERGFSVSSIKLFCKKQGLSSRLSKENVSDMVRAAVEEVLFLISFYKSNVPVLNINLFLP